MTKVNNVSGNTNPNKKEENTMNEITIISSFTRENGQVTGRGILEVQDNLLEINIVLFKARYCNLQEKSLVVLGGLMDDIVEAFNEKLKTNPEGINLVEPTEKLRRGTFIHEGNVFSVSFFKKDSPTEDIRACDRRKSSATGKNGKNRFFFNSPVRLIAGPLHTEALKILRKATFIVKERQQTAQPQPKVEETSTPALES